MKDPTGCHRCSRPSRPSPTALALTPGSSLRVSLQELFHNGTPKDHKENSHQNRLLKDAKEATRSKKLLGAPSNAEQKTLLGAPGIATRSKEATSNKDVGDGASGRLLEVLVLRPTSHKGSPSIVKADGKGKLHDIHSSYGLFCKFVANVS